MRRSLEGYSLRGDVTDGVTGSRRALATERGHVDLGAIHGQVETIVAPVLLVGGSVRDAVMGRECNDVDVATPLGVDEIEAAIRAAGRRPYLMGRRYGTVGVRLDGRLIEISTLAEADGPPGGADRVMADLGRRDFTIDAMAFDGRRIIDPFGGHADIAGRVVRATGDADARFLEDALRILRAARIAAQLEFGVDQATLESMTRHAPSLLAVARERWMTELDALLMAPAAGAGVRILAQTRVVPFILPELCRYPVGVEHGTHLEHTAALVSAVPADDPTARWAALLHDVGEGPAGGPGHEADLIGGEIVERIALALRWSNERRREVARLVREQGEPGSLLARAHAGLAV